LVIHRAWTKLGGKLPVWLAWFITFNFINIAWIFFRAKEWDDALKVLEGMFSLDNFVLPKVLESKIGFLTNYGVDFGFFYWYSEILIWLPLTFWVLLRFKNSMQQLKHFKLTLKTAIFSGFIFAVGVVFLNKVSEFLYFNF